VGGQHLLALRRPIGAKVRSAAAVVLVGFGFALLTGGGQAAGTTASADTAFGAKDDF
jgi:hypothetical protein